MLTDGVASLSESDSLSHAAKSARQHGVQIYAVGIGCDESTRDVQLDDLLVDELAFVGDPVLFVARLRAFGSTGETLTIQLKESSRTRVLAQQQVVAGPDGQSVKVEVMYTPEAAGEAA